MGTIVHAPTCRSDPVMCHGLSCGIEARDVAGKPIAKPDDPAWIGRNQVWARDEYRVDRIFSNGDIPAGGWLESGNLRDPFAIFGKPDVPLAIAGDAIWIAARSRCGSLDNLMRFCIEKTNGVAIYFSKPE